ncbi:hypothetical protein E4U55_002171 [Claviceps digitariae]|nr:hypothetical protein E4U55_002171 [Claviceps digitariae]
MQLLTSATLAVMAIFAGQALGDCVPTTMPDDKKHWVTQCTKQAPDAWLCPNAQVSVIGSKGQYQLYAGTKSIIATGCRKYFPKDIEFACDAGSGTLYPMECGPDDEVYVGTDEWLTQAEIDARIAAGAQHPPPA